MGNNSIIIKAKELNVSKSINKSIEKKQILGKIFLIKEHRISKLSCRLTNKLIALKTKQNPRKIPRRKKKNYGKTIVKKARLKKIYIN